MGNAFSRTSDDIEDSRMPMHRPDGTDLQTPIKSATDSSANTEKEMEDNADGPPLEQTKQPIHDDTYSTTHEARLRSPQTVSSYKSNDAPKTSQLESKQITVNKGTRKSPRSKTAIITPPKPLKWKWTEAADRIILEAVSNHMKTAEESKLSLGHVWGELASQFGIEPIAVYTRWTKYLNPNINHSPMTREDDLRLWEGHTIYGSWWSHINSKFFGGTRPLLRERWSSAQFIKFVKEEFGPEAYTEANNQPCPSHATVLSIGKETNPPKKKFGPPINKKGHKGTGEMKSNSVQLKQESVKSVNKPKAKKKSSKRVSNGDKSNPPAKKPRQDPSGKYNWTEDDDQIICKAVAEYLKAGDIRARLWSVLGKQFGVPDQAVSRRWFSQLNPDIDRSEMSEEDDLRLWQGHRTFGKKWQQISDEYFESTRYSEFLRNRWRSSEFQDRVRNKFGPNAFHSQNECTHSGYSYKQPANNSMDRFSNDILYRIASFSPSLVDLVSLCSTSKQAHLIMKDNCLSDKLYRGLFLRKFGADEVTADDCSWKERWICAFDFKKSFKEIKDSQSGGFVFWPHTVGVIQPPAYEKSAILYDNPKYDIHGDSSHGYFGLQSLCLVKPPNASQDWESPLVLRGDFNGVRLFKSLSALKENSNPNRFLSLGDDEEGGQVLTLILSNSIDQDIVSPCCFLGYASGRVSAMTCSLTEDGTDYLYSLSSWHAHSAEVTSLAIENNPRPILFSACCDGDVYYYPSPTRASKAFSNLKKCPILSMACTEISNRDGKTMSIIITGDQSGTIRLWSVNVQEEEFFSICSKGGRGNHPVTVANIIIQNNTKLLVTGNTNGDVQFWSIGMNTGLHPKLNLVRDHPGIHTGAVEMCRMISGVLVTSGGNDGKLIGFDPSSCCEIGILFCHQGKSILLPNRTRRRTMMSCAVSALIPSASERKLITLCRDGDMADWTFSAAE